MIKIAIVVVTLFVFVGIYDSLFSGNILTDISSFVRRAILGISSSPSMKVCNRYMDKTLDKNDFYDLLLAIDSRQCNYAKFFSGFHLEESELRSMLDEIDPEMTIVRKANCSFYKERLGLVIIANSTDFLLEPGDVVNITRDEDILICRAKK